MDFYIKNVIVKTRSQVGSCSYSNRATWGPFLKIPDKFSDPLPYSIYLG